MQEQFGEKIPFCEPYWYQGGHSPYYTENHKKYRALVRDFVEREVKPNVDKWLKTGYPKELHQKSCELGVESVVYPREFGGKMPQDYDPFYEMILYDEVARVGGGMVLGHIMINGLGLPPIIAAGTPELKKRVLPDVVAGKKFVCLAITEPTAGSDVAGIRATARREGDFYIVSGVKKWITGGAYSDFFTTAVRTGGEGMGGISLLVLEKDMPGITIRKMETQFDTSHNTTFITLEDVKVPVANLLGKENQGFKLIMANFNHERFIIAAETCRKARICYEESIKYALQRRTFGKRLVEHQIIRYKLAEMARLIEALYDNLERVGFQFKSNVPDAKLGGQCALLKVNASRTFEFCAREAAQIFGGNSIVKEGKGKIIERLYREVRGSAIPGGSEEILLDFVIRQAATEATKSKL
ncbi:acyl-CoA dehydrogenase [Acrasis kona]|uniref:Acyl-CoA dehydrogenase n=1 Tax=Acrasis kona TaxID=1008807 RepID=A0AAW2ZRT5_9EUKA